MAMYIEHFKIRREMICHEDTQINHRVGFQLTVQSFLLTAAVILLNNAELPRPILGFVLFTISAVAIILGWFFHRAVSAARKEQARIRGDEMPEGDRPAIGTIFKLADDPDDDRKYCACLQAHGITLGQGFSYIPWVQWLMSVVWLPFVVLGILESCGAPVLARHEVPNEYSWLVPSRVALVVAAAFMVSGLCYITGRTHEKSMKSTASV